jgi:hypothetical protein
MPLRVGIIGPHRRRTGTGPFVAEHLRRRGCAVAAWEGEEARGLLDFKRPPPPVDAVAICSPASTHLEYLYAAVSKGLHVFCEKPIVWPEDHSLRLFDERITALEGVLDAAERNGLVLHENTQWTYTLDDFRRSGVAFQPEELTRFRCEFSPGRETAVEMLMECSAHANSLLLELGCSGIERPAARFRPGAALDLAFASRSVSGRPVGVQYRFERQTGQPRHAAYEINACRIERRVEMERYRILLKVGAREFAIRDPLHRSLDHFLDKVRRGAPGAFRDRIAANIRISRRLLETCLTELEVCPA